jgi:hypothetical protein
MCIYIHIYIYLVRPEWKYYSQNNTPELYLYCSGQLGCSRVKELFKNRSKKNRKAFEKHSKAFNSVLEWEKGSGVQIIVWELLSSEKLRN